MKKFVALLAATLLLPLLTGCPTGSQQKKAAQADENVSSVLSAASQSEIAAFNQGQQCLQVATTDVQKASCIVIPQADHDFIQTQFRSVAEAQKALNTCIVTASNGNAGIIACVQTASTTISTINSQGALGLKSDKAKTIFSGVMSAVNIGIQTIATVLGGTQ